VLVIRGEAGIGKTALLDYCAGGAFGCRLAHVAGVESEFELPFAALHQLCRPMLADLDGLPQPQQQALQAAFGLAAGSAPDRFVVGRVGCASGREDRVGPYRRCEDGRS
jgi:hypothetical protein